MLQVITIDTRGSISIADDLTLSRSTFSPAAMLPTTRIIEREAAKAGLRLMRKELFGKSYARTLDAWQNNFQKAWPLIERLGFEERFKRTWEYYLAYCQPGSRLKA